MNDAYQEGYDSYRKGVTLEANPYAGDERDRWNEGFEDAKIDSDLDKEMDRKKFCTPSSD